MLSMIFLILIFVLYSSTGFTHHGSYHDYFIADKNPDIKLHLLHTDTYHTNKAADLIHKGNPTHAIGDLMFTLRHFPNHPKALLLMGAIARLSGNPMSALPYYERAIRLFPQHAITYAQYGAYLVDIGHGDAGIAKLQRAIELDPRSAFAYGWLAQAYAKAGQLELAQRAAIRARELGFQGELPGSAHKYKPKQ